MLFEFYNDDCSHNPSGAMISLTFDDSYIQVATLQLHNKIMFIQV